MNLTCCRQHVLTSAIHAAQPKNTPPSFSRYFSQMARNVTDHALCNLNGKPFLIFRLISSLFSTPKGTMSSVVFLSAGWTFHAQWTCGRCLPLWQKCTSCPWWLPSNESLRTSKPDSHETSLSHATAYCFRVLIGLNTKPYIGISHMASCNTKAVLLFLVLTMILSDSNSRAHGVAC